MALPPEELRAIAPQKAGTGRKRVSNNPNLTPRELEVLAFLPAGKTNQEIATKLHVSVGTVKAHLSFVYAKLGVSNRTEAALVGMRKFPMLRTLAS